MSNDPILLFLHGVGTGDHDSNWLAALNESLARIDYPAVNESKVIAPKYAEALKGVDDRLPLPPITSKPLSKEAATTNRRDFERRIGALEFHLGRHNEGRGWGGGEALVNFGIGLALGPLSPFVQAQNYKGNPHIRAHVLDRILSQIPDKGRILIVAHSLGSVIAADLLPRLALRIDVVGMVTIGSPLACGTFDVEDLRKTLKDPPQNLAWWLNFWNAPDIVAAHRGVSSVFPWLVDFRIDTKSLPLEAHAAVQYLGNETVAEAIGLGLFGSKSKEMAVIDRGVDIRLDEAESLVLLALRYAHLISERLDTKAREQYSGALRQVQATAIASIRERNLREKRPMPAEIARLWFDVSDPHAAVPTPPPTRHVNKEEAVVLLTTLESENIIHPFEISISTDKKTKQDPRLEAMKELSAEMGLTSKYGADVFAAAKTAQEALNGERGINWKKWGALGIGTAALIAGPVGLALAAGAGLAGGAVIVSALASFGPGGMIGGLLTAGTLVGAGSGGIALGLASSGTTAEALEAVVVRQLSAAILRKRQLLDQDPTIWKNLAEIEVEVRRQHERIDEFSDKDSASVKELDRKIRAVERALNYLRENGLEPYVPVTKTNSEEKETTKRSGLLALLPE